MSGSTNMTNITVQETHHLHSNHVQHINHSHHDNVNFTTTNHHVRYIHHQMYMYFNTQVFSLLAESWSNDSVLGMVTSLVVTALLSVLLEVVKSCLYYHELRARRRTSDRSLSQIVLRTCHTCLYGIRVLIGYLLMLVAMTYNAWLVTCVILGSAIGYFLVQPFLLFYIRRMFLKNRVLSTQEENGRLVEDVEGTVKEELDVSACKGSKPDATNVVTSFIEKT